VKRNKDPEKSKPSEFGDAQIKNQSDVMVKSQGQVGEMGSDGKDDPIDITTSQNSIDKEIKKLVENYDPTVESEKQNQAQDNVRYTPKKV